MSDPDGYLTLNVGGFHYEVKRATLLKFPDSLFEKMSNSEWKEASDAVVEIHRDGELFKYVYDFMYYGTIPRNGIGMSLVGDTSRLKEVKQEADFYHLPGLMAECDELLGTCEVEHRIKHYASVMQEIAEAKSTLWDGECNVVYENKDPDCLITLLRSSPYDPAWVTGTLDQKCNPVIFRSTTVQNVNVSELVAAALPSSFGKGSETVLDKNVRDSIEIPASELCNLQEIVDGLDFSSLAPNRKLSLKPYKLVVYQEGGHFDSHRDTVRDKNHIGTLVLILNSEYTGGELEVRHGEHKVIVTGASKWVAMYGDCVHTIHPVTSGTRVSLIFDIWNESEEVNTKRRKRSLDIDYDYEFWRGHKINTEFWLGSGSAATNPTDTAVTHTPTLGLDTFWTRIYAALDKELENNATVSICLEHLYPVCQANPDFFKGGDARLYYILKDKYSLGVTSVTLARSKTDDDEKLGYYELGPEQLLDPTTNVMFVPNAMSENSILFYQEGLEYTGNEAQPKELVYLVAALVVRKK